MRRLSVVTAAVVAFAAPAPSAELVTEKPSVEQRDKYAEFGVADSLAAPDTAAAPDTVAAATPVQPVYASWRTVADYTIEPTYISALSGFNHPQHLLFEANISPAFQVSRFHDFSVVVSPKVILRMLSRQSSPVRTPSFMPRVMLLRMPEPEGGRRYTFLSMMLSHHSNGQEGDFLAQGGSANITDGSFSCNFLRLGWHWIRNIRAQRTDEPLRSVDYLEVAAQWYPNLNRSPELEGHYGFFRTSAKYRNYFRQRGWDLALQGEVTTLWGELERLDPTADRPERFIADTKVFYRPKWSENFGFYVDWYFGQDYYNIRFVQNLNVFRAGIATDLPVLDVGP
jgi:hypothetical protein